MSEFKLTAPPATPARKGKPSNPIAPAPIYPPDITSISSPVSKEDSHSVTPTLSEQEARAECLGLFSDSIDRLNEWRMTHRIDSNVNPFAMIRLVDKNNELREEWIKLEQSLDEYILAGNIDQTKVQCGLYEDCYKKICGEYWTVGNKDNNE